MSWPTNPPLVNRELPQLAHGLWIWQLEKLRSDYIEILPALNCGIVYLKVFDDLNGPRLWDNQCTPQLITKFHKQRIAVIGWGYHFDQRFSVDTQLSAAEVAKGIACGLDGYVVDVEDTIENLSTHADLDALLVALRQVCHDRLLGYTSFGHPGFHAGIPWRLLNSHCDAAFPQMYFEDWSFGPTVEVMVQSALNAHGDMGLSKPLFPIWSSEDGAIRPASAEVLQSYLNRFPGSSIFRAPNVGERGQAWRLDYAGGSPMLTIDRVPPLKAAPYRGVLRLGDSGPPVKDLQNLLLSSGTASGPLDGILGEVTYAALKAFQFRSGETPDGIAGPETWAALGGMVPDEASSPNQFAEQLAQVAETEAQKNLRWTDPSCEADKYLEPFRLPMRRLGQIGDGPVFYNWCAAFVAYCCRKAGFPIPDQPAGFWATMALVESWKYWSVKNGTWLSSSVTSPRRGDIVCFEWNDGDVGLDHIGVVRQHSDGLMVMETSEGNRGNVCKNGTRQLAGVAGIIRLANWPA
jgi:hypothetical protein